MTTGSSVRDVLVALGFTSITDAGKNYRCRPSYRDSSSATVCSVQKENGLWYDFRENIGGNLQDLVSLCLNVDKESARKFLSDKNYEPTEIDEREEVLTTTKKYPIEWLSHLEQSSTYWASRGVSEATLNKFRGGIATTGRMYHRYVFPIFDEREAIVGFVGRDLLKLNNNNRPKWKILGEKKEFAYPYFLNKAAINKEKSVILIESLGDNLALWDSGIENTLVTFGISLGSGVVKVLLKSQPKEIIIALNNDINGNSAGNNAALEFKRELGNYFDPDTVKIKLPFKKDFGDMSREEIALWKNQI